MLTVTCPSCGGKGSIPDQLAGKKIKCQKCGMSFQAVPVTAEFPHLAEATAGIVPTGSRGESIEVAGLDPSAWTATPAAATPATPAVVAVEQHEPDHEAHGFSASPPAAPPAEAPRRHYKLLTQKDRFFEGKFDLARLEEALNHYASEGWTVRAMSTPLVTGFSGGPREEIVVILER